MMRLNKKRIFAIALLLALFALMQLLCAWRVQAIERSLPHAAAIDNPTGVGITMGQALSTHIYQSVGHNPRIENMNVGAMSLQQRQTISVSGVGASEPAYTAYATPAAGMSLSFQYVYGNWFPMVDGSIAPLAVLPESLSLTLFGTNKPAGNSISVGQLEFRICGVYREETGFLQKISGDGLPYIYLYNPLYMAQLPVAVLYLSDDKQGDVQLLKQQAANAFKTKLVGEIVDFRQQIQLARSLWYMSVLLCVMLPVIMLLCFAALQFIRFHAGHELTSKWLKRLSLGIFIPVGILAALMLFLNQFRIPAVYLPQDNIFEISFYVNAIVSFFQTLSNSGVSNYERIFVTQLCALLLSALLGIVFFIAVVSGVRKLVIPVTYDT